MKIINKKKAYTIGSCLCLMMLLSACGKNIDFFYSDINHNYHSFNDDKVNQEFINESEEIVIKIEEDVNNISEVETNNNYLEILETTTDIATIVTDLDAELNTEFNKLIPNKISKNKEEIESNSRESIDEEIKTEEVLETEEISEKINEDVPQEVIEENVVEYPSYFSAVNCNGNENVILNGLNNLPQVVKERTIYYNYSVVAVGTEGYLEAKFGYKKIKGLTDLGTNTIYVECFRANVKSLDTLYHELGHAFDMNSGNLSSTEEFYNIFASEYGLAMQTSYFSGINSGIKQNFNSPIEYFASTFSMYMICPNDLMVYCPQTYNYINSLLNLYALNNNSQVKMLKLC